MFPQMRIARRTRRYLFHVLLLLIAITIVNDSQSRRLYLLHRSVRRFNLGLPPRSLIAHINLLQEYLGRIVADPAKTRFAKLRLLCRSLAGNGVYYLTITAPTHDEEVRRKRGVVITARVHPGETPSSWTMKGIIDFLTGDTNRARVRRDLATPDEYRSGTRSEDRRSRERDLTGD